MSELVSFLIDFGGSADSDLKLSGGLLQVLVETWMRGRACQGSWHHFFWFIKFNKKITAGMFLQGKKQVKTCVHAQRLRVSSCFSQQENIRGSFSLKGKLILYLLKNEQYIKHKYIESRQWKQIEENHKRKTQQLWRRWWTKWSQQVIRVLVMMMSSRILDELKFMDRSTKRRELQ